jgi:hypothetical protein
MKEGDIIETPDMGPGIQIKVVMFDDANEASDLKMIQLQVYPLQGAEVAHGLGLHLLEAAKQYIAEHKLAVGTPIDLMDHVGPVQ